MRRIISLLSCLCMLVGLFACTGSVLIAKADGGEYLTSTDAHGITWNYSLEDVTENAIQVHPADPTQISGQLLIPDELDGHTVTQLKDYAFRANTDITGVIMHDNIVDLGIGTFDMCTSLTIVQLSNNITSLKTYIFDGCHTLWSINIPENLESVSQYAFYDCPMLDYMRLPETVTFIGQGAFQKCTALTEIYIDSVNVTFGNGECAFDEDDTVHIYGGSNFVSYLEENNITYMDHGYQENSSASSDLQISMNTTNVSVTLPISMLCQVNPNVEGNRGFVCSDVAVKNNAQMPIELYLTFFGQGAVSNRTFIEPDEITTKAGKSWDKLDAINTSKYMALGLKPGDNWATEDVSEYLYANSTYNKVKLGTIAGGNTAGLNFTAYYGKSYAKSDRVDVRMIFVAELSDTEIHSEPSLFLYNVTDAYAEDTNVDGTMVSGEVEVVSFNTATATSLNTKRIKIPETVVIDEKTYLVTSIAQDAFAAQAEAPNVVLNSGIEEVRFSNKLERIGINAFGNCDSITYIDIPYSVTAIADNAFNGCSKLKYIYVNGTPSVGSGCFANIGDNSSIVYVYDANLKSTLLSNTYTNNSNVRLLGNHKTPIEVIEYGNTTMTLYKEDGDNYALFSGVGSCGEFLETDSQILESMFQNNGGHVTIIIDDYLTDIGVNMFRDMTTIDKVIVGGNVALIDTDSFSGSSIKIVQIPEPNKLRNIRNRAFKNCTELENFGYTGLLNYVGGSAFENCTKLTSFSLPLASGVYTSSFANCTSLKFVYARGGDYGEDTFNGTSAKVYLQSQSHVDYLNSRKPQDALFEVTQITRADTEAMCQMFYDNTVRSLWCWGEVELDDYDELLQFMLDNNLNRLYKAVGLVDDLENPEGVAKVESFIEAFNNAGIEVWWTNGDPSWAIHEYGTIDVVDRIKAYNDSTEHKFSGINFDNEVHCMNGFSTNASEYVSEYVECCKNTYEYAKSKDIKIMQTMSSWLYNTYQSALSEVVKGYCDGLAIMNYVTESPNNEINKALIDARSEGITIESICSVDGSQVTDADSFATMAEAVSYNKLFTLQYQYSKLGFSYHNYGRIIAQAGN